MCSNLTICKYQLLYMYVHAAYVYVYLYMYMSNTNNVCVAINVAHSLQVCVLKESLGFGLEELEVAAQQVLADEAANVNKEEDSSEETEGSDTSSVEDSSESSEVENSLEGSKNDSKDVRGDTDQLVQELGSGQDGLSTVQPSVLEHLVNLSISDGG